MDGIIIIFKEKGFTSHDVVAKLRGILKQKKIGHTGTLDPDAEGVLPVCLGKGTKVCDLLTNHSKEYHAVLKLGIKTDTQDMTGAILEENTVMADEDTIRQTIMEFVGSYDQIPPMYSALKVNGKKLYEIAREGKTVERKARRVTINHIRIETVDMANNEITFLVDCSKGTYIRTLCEDIGNKLGCGGCMKSLLRTRVGDFTLEDSITLTEVQKKRDEGTVMDAVMSIDSVFMEMPEAKVLSAGMKFLNNGNSLKLSYLSSSASADELMQAEQIRIYNERDEFSAIYKYDDKQRMFVPEKMFLS
ncbi:MAG: tRNA pseudouridine(55) synthase TruB [Lachnospiraceae bacterium]|nr:tRNA pseudouridine(55) synthase TruB [Lachnospiraceae bacterium]